jgi:hypothetical protein
VPRLHMGAQALPVSDTRMLLNGSGDLANACRLACDMCAKITA